MDSAYAAPSAAVQAPKAGSAIRAGSRAGRLMGGDAGRLPDISINSARDMRYVRRGATEGPARSPFLRRRPRPYWPQSCLSSCKVKIFFAYAF